MFTKSLTASGQDIYFDISPVTAIIRGANGTTHVLTASGHNLHIQEKFEDFTKTFFDSIDEEVITDNPQTSTIDEKSETE